MTIRTQSAGSDGMMTEKATREKMGECHQMWKKGREQFVRECHIYALTLACTLAFCVLSWT